MEEIKDLSQEQVMEVVKFAQALYGGTGYGGYNVFNPDILNKNLSGLNVNIKQPTLENLSQALDKPIDNQENLMGYNEWAELNDMMFKKVIEYYSNMLAFDLSVTCTNVDGDYNHPNYKADKSKLYSFLDKFDYKHEFEKIVKQMVRRETVFTFFRNDKGASRYVIQQMPQKYCKVTGACEWTMLYDFDMAYFTNPSVTTAQFPKCFEDYYREVFSDGKSLLDYNPMNGLTRRDGTYALWHQTSPDDGAWVFKLDESMYGSLPFLSPMIYDVLVTPVIRNMQKNKNIASAYAILTSEIPFLQEAKATKSDQFSVDLGTLGTFLRLMKDGLSETIKVASLPAKEIDMFQYEDKNKEMYSYQLKSTAGMGVSANRLIYSDDKVGQFELENQILTDYNIMAKCYGQFQRFLEFFANKEVGSKYRYYFKFRLEGSNYPFIRKKRTDEIMKLAEMGLPLKAMIGSCHGFAPQEFERMLEESKAEKFELQSIHTATEKGIAPTEKGGKPTNESKDVPLTESGEKTKNIDRS